jgi:hypothetical protein
VDFNPQIDRQAEDRCHRLGQTKPVMVYRLVTERSVDHNIYNLSQRKLKLDAAVLDGITSTSTARGERGQERDQMGFILHSLFSGRGEAAVYEEMPEDLEAREREEREERQATRRKEREGKHEEEQHEGNEHAGPAEPKEEEAPAVAVEEGAATAMATDAAPDTLVEVKEVAEVGMVVAAPPDAGTIEEEEGAAAVKEEDAETETAPAVEVAA